jgi:hypothetical protein
MMETETIIVTTPTPRIEPTFEESMVYIDTVWGSVMRELAE